MTIDEFFRDEISRGQQPLVALNNAAQEYANSLRKRPDCSQYADETAAWSEPQDSEAVALLREFIEISTIDSLSVRTARLTDLLPRVLKVLEGKQ